MSSPPLRKQFSLNRAKIVKSSAVSRSFKQKDEESIHNDSNPASVWNGESELFYENHSKNSTKPNPYLKLPPVLQQTRKVDSSDIQIKPEEDRLRSLLTEENRNKTIDSSSLFVHNKFKNVKRNRSSSIVVFTKVMQPKPNPFTMSWPLSRTEPRPKVNFFPDIISSNQTEMKQDITNFNKSRCRRRKILVLKKKSFNKTEREETNDQSTVHKTSTSERSSSPSNKFNQLTIDAIKALEVKRRCKRFHCCYCKSEKRKVGPSPTSSNTSVHSDDSAETECIGLDQDGDAIRKSGSSNIQVDDKTSDVLKIICEST